MNSDLTLICETCGFPIARDKGCIYIRTGDVSGYQRDMREWREVYPEGSAVDLTELDGYPDDIHWRTGHDACRTDRDEGCYEIDGDRIATWPLLAHWTAHLMEKNWFADSDWDELLREIAGEIPSRRIRSAASQAAA